MTARARNLAIFGLLLLVALIIRSDTFGDPNLHGDEVFYQIVGTAMHHGAVPYVDLWDRKPLGLFLIFYLIAFVSEAPLAYQLVATLFAAGTAWAIAMLAIELHPRAGGDASPSPTPLTLSSSKGVGPDAAPASFDELRTSGGGAAGRPLGALLAGVAYILWLAPLQGYGGQSPVFYNLFIALAALLVVRALPNLRQGRMPAGVPAAMLLAGLGITVKTSAVAEAAFLGLVSAGTLWRSDAGAGRILRNAALWAAIGAAPTLAIGFAYWAIGHWDAWWHAMVVSNLEKRPSWYSAQLRIMIMTILLSPILLIAAFGLIERKVGRAFVLGWIAAAIVGMALVPNFYLHYALPLLVPLCLAASPFLARGAIGAIAVAGLAALSFWVSEPFDYAHAARSRAALDKLEAAVRAHIRSGPLLLYDAPPQLYQRTGQPFITPLVFPTHLSHLIEKDVSQFSTLGETRRALALRPGAVVMAQPIRNGPVNEETHQLVLAYVGKNCRIITVVPTPERERTDMIVVWGDCRR